MCIYVLVKNLNIVTCYSINMLSDSVSGHDTSDTEVVLSVCTLCSGPGVDVALDGKAILLCTVFILNEKLKMFFIYRHENINSTLLNSDIVFHRATNCTGHFIFLGMPGRLE